MVSSPASPLQYHQHPYASHQGYPLAVLHQNTSPHVHMLFSPLPDLPTPESLFNQTSARFHQGQFLQQPVYQPFVQSLSANSLYSPNAVLYSQSGVIQPPVGFHDQDSHDHHIKHPTENPELLANRVAEHPRLHNHLEVSSPAHLPAANKMIPVMPMRQPYEVPDQIKPIKPNENKPSGHTHDHGAENAKPSRWKALAKAVGLIGFGLALHSLPARKSSLGSPLISSDWKDIARIVLGIGAVQQINKALDWKPAPWLSAIQAVAVMNPIATGVLTKEGLLSLRNLGQIAVMSVLVAPLVQISATLDKKVLPKLKEDWGIPSWIPRLGMMVGMMGAGLYAYPKMFNWVSRQTIMGRPLLGQQAMKDALHQLQHAKENAAAGAIMCYRNCCAGSIVCLSELGEILSSFMNGVTGKNKVQKGEQN
jgi:hypothetical protein